MVAEAESGRRKEEVTDCREQLAALLEKCPYTSNTTMQADWLIARGVQLSEERLRPGFDEFVRVHAARGADSLRPPEQLSEYQSDVVTMLARQASELRDRAVELDKLADAIHAEAAGVPVRGADSVAAPEETKP